MPGLFHSLIGGNISFLFHSFPGGYFIAISFFSKRIFHSCIIPSQGIFHFHFISFSYHSFLGGYIISISFFLRGYFIPISFFPRRIYIISISFLARGYIIPVSFLAKEIFHSHIILSQGDIILYLEFDGINFKNLTFIRLNFHA